MAGLTKRVRGEHLARSTDAVGVLGTAEPVPVGPPLSADRLESILTALTDGAERGPAVATTLGEVDR